MREPLLMVWPGGEHEFALRMGEWRALQEACSAGPEELFNRIRLGKWKTDDFTHILRIGLIGGGMPQQEARAAIMGVIDLYPPMEFKLAAMNLLAFWLLGPADDTPKKPEGVENPENGNSPTSTEPEAN